MKNRIIELGEDLANMSARIANEMNYHWVWIDHHKIWDIHLEARKYEGSYQYGIKFNLHKMTWGVNFDLEGYVYRDDIIKFVELMSKEFGQFEYVEMRRCYNE